LASGSRIGLGLSCLLIVCLVGAPPTLPHQTSPQGDHGDNTRRIAQPTPAIAVVGAGGDALPVGVWRGGQPPGPDRPRRPRFAWCSSM